MRQCRRWFIGLALALLVGKASASQDLHIPLPGRVEAMSWNPTGGQLLYATQDAVYVWPWGKRIELPMADPDQTRTPSQVRYNKRGDKALVFGNYTWSIHVVDLVKGTAKEIPGDCQTAFWVGDEVARIRPHIKNDAWTERQYVQVGSRKRDLPRSMSFSAVDSSGTVFLAKEQKSMGAIALYRFDPRTLRVQLLRRHRGPHYIEYTERDQLDWDPKTRTAAIGLTADTGATLAELWLSSRQGLRPYGRQDEMLFLSNQARFNGAGLLIPTRSQIDLFDLRAGRRKVLRALPPWQGQDDFEGIYAAALSPNGTRLAWSQDKGKRHALYIRGDVAPR
jgi:hypothetical protein